MVATYRSDGCHVHASTLVDPTLLVVAKWGAHHVAPILPFGPFSFGVVAVDDDPEDETPYFFPAPVIFANGFKIGNTSVWSGTTP